MMATDRDELIARLEDRAHDLDMCPIDAYQDTARLLRDAAAFLRATGTVTVTYDPKAVEDAVRKALTLTVNTTRSETARIVENIVYGPARPINYQQ